MVTALEAPEASIAAPTEPVIVPEFTIAAPPLNVTPEPIKIPVLAVIVPVLLTLPANVEIEAKEMPAPPAETAPLLVMPPVNVGPEILMAVTVEAIWLAPSIRMPWLEPRMVPLSTIAPVMVAWTMLIAVCAVIVPLLETLPTKVEIGATVPLPVR